MSAYLPPVPRTALPRTRDEWRRRAGLTDPSLLSGIVNYLVLAGGSEDLTYADFFRIEGDA